MLQTQYPLSSRKFWKKLLPKLSSFFLLPILAGLVLFVFALSPQPGQQIVTISSSSILGICLILYLVQVLPYAWYLKVYIKRYYYDANDSYVTIKKGVFAPTEIHVQYSKIQDVYVDQDILDRIMGLYDVHLATATVTSGIEAHIDGVDATAAAGLKQFLLQKLQAGNSGNMMSSAYQAAGPAAPTPNAPVNFTQELSSMTYPIGGAWYAQQAVSWLFTSLLYSALLSFYAATKDVISSAEWMWVFIGLFLVIYLFHLVYMVLWKNTFSFNFLPDYIVTKQGIISKRENHLPYRAIQDVTVSQGIIERLFGVATVRIENAAATQMVGNKVISSAVLLPGQPLAQAQNISEVLKQVILTQNSSQTGL